MSTIPFGTTNWQEIEPEQHNGEQGYALWRTAHIHNIRIRMVDYSAGYLVDHWCSKGHVLLCLTANCSLNWTTAEPSR